MRIYQERHYEDVARFVNHVSFMQPKALATPEMKAQWWINLFTADNPPTCYVDGDHDGECDDGCMTRGFDRERFLKACGLE